MQKSDPRRDTRERVAELHAQGLPASQIARTLRITPQRVYFHLAKLRAETKA